MLVLIIFVSLFFLKKLVESNKSMLTTISGVDNVPRAAGTSSTNSNRSLKAKPIAKTTNPT